MTREEFIKVLDGKGYSYEIEGDKIVVTYYYDLWLNSLETLPHDVEFRNGGHVYLDSLKTLPLGVEFKNVRNVRLGSLKTLPLGVEFKNGGDVNLDDLIGGNFDEWKGNIEGIDSKRLLNLMISKGVFER
jgi:hypothetical protein